MVYTGLTAVPVASIFDPALLELEGANSQKYQFVRPEKNTKYARGTNTLNLKRKL
jgi:hypothetical protein